MRTGNVIRQYQEYEKLSTMSGVLRQRTIFSFTNSGLFYYNYQNSREKYANYWEKAITVHRKQAYRLGFGDVDIFLQGNYGVYAGLSVRCEAK